MASSAPRLVPPKPAPPRAGRSAFPRLRRSRALVAAAALSLPLVGAATASAAPAGPGIGRGLADQRFATVQVLSINDFHGNLEPPSGSGGLAPDDNGVRQPAGGAVYLAAHYRTLQAQRAQQYTVGVAAGDLIGASPLVSALFHDEPTIEFLNQLGLFASSTGNHEYDEGLTELLRMQRGGCHPTDGCFGGDGFMGAGFTYLSANVTDTGGRLVMPAYAVKTIEPGLTVRGREILPGLKIGFIGLPLKDTPSIVTATGVAGLRFGDEVTAVNKAAAALRRQGVRSIVLLVHQGDSVVSSALPNQCGDIPGPSRAIAERVSADVDVVFSGHSHQAYNCTVTDPAGNPRPFVQGSSFGRYITEVDLTIDRLTRDVVRSRSTAVNHLVTRDVAPDPQAQALVARYLGLSAPIANRKVGTISADLGRAASPAGESALGDVIADAQRAATAAPDKGGAVVALMNPGGIRADLTYSSSPVGEGDGVVTYGEAFTVQPFTNYLTTITLSGAQLKTVLEQQVFPGPTTGQGRILQVSSSLHYAWSASAPVGSKVDPASLTINGVVVDPVASYRVTVNSFLAGGGDGFLELAKGTNPLVGAIDVDSFVDYLKTSGTVSPPPADRITVVP